MASTPVGGKPCKLTPGQTAAVRGELESVLSSPYFAGAKRCRALLDFVVHCALSGNLDDLTERTLGAELFGRPIDYETGSDAIVRVRANDVRRRLAEYCSAPHPSSQVAISLPSGSHIPEFTGLPLKCHRLRRSPPQPSHLGRAAKRRPLGPGGSACQEP